MPDYTPFFAATLEQAPTYKGAETLLRAFIEELAKDCPMHVLLAMGRAVLDVRKEELRKEAEAN